MQLWYKVFPTIANLLQEGTRIIERTELKTLYGYDQGSDLVLYSNREILVDNKPVYPSK